MLVFIALIPFVLAMASYVRSYRDLFVPLQEKEPTSWQWKASQPILTSAVSPLVLAAKEGLAAVDILLLIGVSLGALVAFTLISISMARVSYFKTQVPMGVLRWEFRPAITPARLVFAIGLVVIAATAGGTVWVGQSI